MKLGPEILKILDKKHDPDSMIYSKFSRYDLAFKTDECASLNNRPSKGGSYEEAASGY
jgi:hypothetical protein